MSCIALIGKKLEMSNMFDSNGEVIPVTLVRVLPNAVIETRDYGDKFSVVLGGNDYISGKHVNKPQRVFLDKNKIKYREDVKEFELSKKMNIALSTELSVGDYLEGAVVDVKGCTIGKGFQGAMKRWGFGGLPASHGVSLTHRSLGSTGNRTLPGRVFKGKKMAGHMGNKFIRVENLKIIKVYKDRNIVAIRGSLPGKKYSTLYITNATKKYTEDDNVFNGIVCEG